MFVSRLLTTAAFTVVASAAHAATFLIDFSVNGSGNEMGSFEAPVGGGVVSNFTASIGGVVFDDQVGGGAFEYDPTAGDFVNASGQIAFTNSAATGICAIGGCGLVLFPLPNDAEPGDYSAIDELFNNIDDGTKYAISSAPDGVVPLPMGAVLLLTGLGALAVTRRQH